MEGPTYVRFLAPALVVVLSTSVAASAKKAKTLELNEPASLGATRIGRGLYDVRCVTHSPEATVTFSKGKTVVATAQGKWVERAVKFSRNALVFEVGADGSRSIIEIRFAGMSQALVLDPPGSNGGAAGGLSSARTPVAAPQALVSTRASQSTRSRFLGKPRTVRRGSLPVDLIEDVSYWPLRQQRLPLLPPRK